MRFVATLAAACLVPAAISYTPASTAGTDKLATGGLKNLVAYELKNHPSAQCTLSTAHVRKEWGSLNGREKKSYIDSVLCLMAKPSISGSLAPGARSRYDDFIGTHINQTLTIHSTGNFLSWHRYYIWTYENALRDECGYKGYLPYWNWGKYAYNITGAPLFDGSDISIGGDGVYKEHPGINFPPTGTPVITLPPSNGGGCITTGPFKNITTHLGPVAPVLTDVQPNPQADGLGYNPRCLRRDLSVISSSTATSDLNSTNLITENTDIASFQFVMQGSFIIGLPLLGVHGAGHYIVGGDPGGDFYTSPGDPYFWLHHGQIDRTWWIWQNQDLATRQNAIAGTITFNNDPPSRNATLDDIIDLGVNAPGIPIRDAMSTLSGPFCYIYE